MKDYHKMDEILELIQTAKNAPFGKVLSIINIKNIMVVDIEGELSLSVDFEFEDKYFNIRWLSDGSVDMDSKTRAQLCR